MTLSNYDILSEATKLANVYWLLRELQEECTCYICEEIDD